MVSLPRDFTLMPRVLNSLWILLCFSAGVLIFLHPSIFSGGRILPGDELDSRLILYLQEHWFRVFQGQTGWQDLEMFYPAPHTLGLSDSFFLFGLSHSFFRSIGLDIYGACLANYLFLAVVGFSGLYILLRREFGITTLVAAWAAGLFLCFSPIVSGPFLSHTQILSVWYLPWLIVALLTGWRAIEGQPRKALLWLSVFAIGLALVLWNAFYTGWFFIFFLCLMGAWRLASRSLRIFRRKADAGAEVGIQFNRKTAAALFEFLKAQRRLIGILLLVLLTALIPFFWTYIPTLLSSGGQSYPKGQLPYLFDLLHVPNTNWLWGDLMISVLGKYADRGESQHGIPLISAVSILIAVVFLMRPRMRTNMVAAGHARVFLPLALITVALCWILLLRVGGISLWRLVYELVPGGNAIRAPFRFNSVLAIPLLCALAVGIEQLKAWLGGQKQAIRWIGAPLLLLAGGAIMAEQSMVHTPSELAFDTERIATRIATYPPVPADAVAFFVIPENRPGLVPNLIAQLDAWAIAQRDDFPTLNGFSGVFPENYKLFKIPGNERPSDYLHAVSEWMYCYGLDEHIFEFNLNDREWRESGPLRLRQSVSTYKLGTPLNGLLQPQPNSLPFDLFMTSGWSGPEALGTWTAAPEAKIIYPLAGPVDPGYRLVLKILAAAFTPESHPQQIFEIWANGAYVSSYKRTRTDPPGARFFPIDPKLVGTEKQIEITIRCPDAVSPMELGVGQDPRRLGLLVQTVELFQEPLP